MPQARYLHAAVVLGDRMLLYGGMTQNGTTLNDFWDYRFQTSSNTSDHSCFSLYFLTGKISFVFEF